MQYFSRNDFIWTSQQQLRRQFWRQKLCLCSLLRINLSQNTSFSVDIDYECRSVLKHVLKSCGVRSSPKFIVWILTTSSKFLTSTIELKFYTLLLDLTSLEDVFFLTSFRFFNSTFVFDIPRCTFSTRFVKSFHFRLDTMSYTKHWNNRHTLKI